MKFLDTPYHSNTRDRINQNGHIYTGKHVTGDHKIYHSGSDYVLFAGEIYSWPDSIDKSTNNPAENILELVVKKGIGHIPKLNGKFSAVIKYNTNIYVTRDFLGTYTPIYYNETLFTNSLKVLKKHQVIDFKADKDALIIFLRRGFIPAPQTPVKGLFKLAPGEYLSYDLANKKLTIKNVLNYESYYANSKTFSGSFKDAINTYKFHHQEAVRSRIKGKSNIALLLSGGYDSGGNLAALREIYQGDIDAYSIGFKNSQWSETPLARVMADRFNARHHIITMEGDEIENMPEVVDIFEEPFFENGLLVNYKISQAINSSDADVILGGDGNDQFFGTRSREMALKYFMQKSGIQVMQKAMRQTLLNSTRYYRYGFHNNAILNALEADEFGFTNKQIKKIMPDSELPEFKKIKSSWFDSYDQLYIKRNFKTDILQSATQVILHKANMTTSAQKLNVVFPYTDPAVFDFVSTLPRTYKVNGSALGIMRNKAQSKHLFKEYLKPVLPDEVINKKKQGGFAPLGIFLDNAQYRKRIYSFVEKVLSDVDFIDSSELNTLFQRFEDNLNKQNQWFWFIQTQHSQIMYLFVLAIWWEHFINDKKAIL